MTDDRIYLTTEQVMLIRQGAERPRHQFEGTFNMETIELGADAKPAVLFLCVHNAGRSQMGAGWMRQLAGDRVDVFSGGTDPGIALNGAAVAAMSEVGIDIAAELPQPWTDEIARAVDVIVSMGQR